MGISRRKWYVSLYNIYCIVYYVMTSVFLFFLKFILSLYTIQSVFYIVGREYLNDVHALHVPTMTWRKVSTTGDSPQRRANHSSCILEETGELFVFGGLE